MEEIENQYSALRFEYSRLRSRFLSLRDSYFNVKNVGRTNEDKVRLLEKQIRSLDNEIDSYKFRNEQYLSRIHILQEELLSKNKKDVKNTSTSDSTSIDFFIETTKAQISAMVEENEQLSRKVIALTLELEKVSKEKAGEIEALKRDNMNLRKNLIVSHKAGTKSKEPKKVNISNYGSAFPCSLPRKILYQLDQSCVSTLSSFYKNFKTIISDLLKSLHQLNGSIQLFDTEIPLSLIKNGYSKILVWKDLPTFSRSRTRDFPVLLRPLIISLAVFQCHLDTIIQLNLKNIRPKFFFFINRIRIFLIEVESIFVTLSNFPSSNVSKTSTHVIEHLFGIMRENVSSITDWVQNFDFPVMLNVSQNDGVSLISLLLNNFKPELIGCVNLLNALIDTELSMLRLYGWHPSGFVNIHSMSSVSSIKFSSHLTTLKNHLTLINNTQADSQLNLSDLSSDSVPKEEFEDLKKQLEEARVRIEELQKDKQLLVFDLKASSTVKSNSTQNTAESQPEKDIASELKRILDQSLTTYINDNHTLYGQLSVLKLENANLNVRFKASENQRKSLDQEVKRLTTTLEAANGDLQATRTNYENRLIELTEEVCHLRSSTSLQSLNSFQPNLKKKN